MTPLLESLLRCFEVGCTMAVDARLTRILAASAGCLTCPWAVFAHVLQFLHACA
jgi:hypothetical protein